MKSVRNFSKENLNEEPLCVWDGLERRGFDKAAIEALQTAFRLLTRSQLNTSQAIERIGAEVPPCPQVDELIEFIRASERGVVK